jgi:hypothetical protein
MGLFRKKKRKEGQGLNEETARLEARGFEIGTSDARHDLGRLKEAARQGRERLSTEKHSLDSQNDYRPGEADGSSSRLKVRLRKSFSQLFLEKNQTQGPPVPRISTDVCSLKIKSLMVVITRPSHISPIFIIFRDVNENSRSEYSGS